ncbi:MAG: SIS domain-containing protein [Burkholderiaceae bacterium]|jgi:D-sedoheptulose 7-phosphate isomerase|nr:SIS domain-containing protein [Burkholderiaceae bacterium]
MLLQRIQQLFIDSADFKYQCAQSMGNNTESAVQAVFSCLTNGGKIMVAGMGATQPLAFYTAALLLGRFERERPELAALALGAHSGNGFDSQGIAREVRALGVSEDLLLVISSKGAEAALVAAVDAAHERDMTVVALVGGANPELVQSLHDTDVAVCVPSEQTSRIHEVMMMVLHCVCDGVDIQLLGDGQ